MFRGRMRYSGTVMLELRRSGRGHPQASRIVQSARDLVGVGFRPQGRGAEGLDCLGLVAAAAASAGLPVRVGRSFPLRGVDIVQARPALEAAGCRLLEIEEALPGDLLLQAPCARQVHLAVKTELGVIEAHAGLRRVVERPVARSECWDSAWRLPMGDA